MGQKLKGRHVELSIDTGGTPPSRQQENYHRLWMPDIVEIKSEPVQEHRFLVKNWNDEVRGSFSFRS